MKLKTRKKGLVIPVTNMADIAYLLLIFIIILSLINHNNRSDNSLPVSGLAAADREEALELTITDTHYLVGNVICRSQNALAEQLVRTEASRPVRISAPAAIEFARIKQVLKLLEKNGLHQVEFQVNREKKP